LGIHSAAPSTAFLFATSSVLAVISLTKFTFCVHAIGALTMLTISMLFKTPRWRAGLPVCMYLLAFLILWLALGQQPGNISSFLESSWQVAAGYDSAMSTIGDRREVFLGAGLALLCASTLGSLSIRRVFTVRQTCLLGVLGFSLFLQWKHGFVRHDEHAVHYFTQILFTAFLLPAFLPAYDWRAVPRVVALAYCIPLSLLGILHAAHLHRNPAGCLTLLAERVEDNVEVAWAPRRYKKELQKKQEALKTQWPLPKIRAIVRDAPVDLISYEQGFLLINGMNWRPRPVFQSYSAYNRYLIDANARFFREANAPPFVLLDLVPIDERLVTLEDSGALIEILKHYEPVAAERSFILFKRRVREKSSAANDSSRVVQKSIHFDEKVDLSDLPPSCQRLYLQIKPSALGTIRKSLYKLPPVYLRVQTTDGLDRSFRLVPEIAASGFLLNPLVLDNSDFVRIYAKNAGRRVASFSITGSSSSVYYQSDVDMKLECWPDLVGSNVNQELANSMLYPMLASAPVAMHSSFPIEPGTYDGGQVLMVEPEGEMIFALREGIRVAQGRFGIAPGAYLQGKTDGVRFTVEYINERGERRLLFDRYLDPLAKPGDRGMQSFAVALEPGWKGRLACRTSNLEGKNSNWDWSYWTAVKLE
jgi:hypothetical protein